jgi:ribose 5-phosphate isomerase A
MNQDEMKYKVAQQALKYVTENTIIGVGTGSTANFFIDALADIKHTIKGTVASSVATAERLQKNGIKIFDFNEVDNISVYIDGADESDSDLNLIKGGGGALTREKIIASGSDKFVCIVDETKVVKELGNFPLPIEVIPMATNYVKHKITKITNGIPLIREDFTTDNGNYIIDVKGLNIKNPVDLETKLNNIVGVVPNGIFANRSADILLIGTKDGVKTIKK